MGMSRKRAEVSRPPLDVENDGHRRFQSFQSHRTVQVILQVLVVDNGYFVLDETQQRSTKKIGILPRPDWRT